MVVIPNSKIKLLKTPFEMADNNQLTFSNVTEQYNYFNSLPKLESEDLTYVRKDGVIRYDGVFDDLIGFNYCMYQNTSYSDKWFYAYILDIEYINDEVTFIKIETDVFQSWQFQINYKRSFVEREHVNDDGLYKNLIPESLDCGEDYINSYSSTFSLGDSYIVMQSTVSPITGTDDSGGEYNGVYGAGKYYTFKNYGALNTGLNRIATAGKSDGIIGLFVAPDWLIKYDTLTWVDNIAEINQTSGYVSDAGFALPLTVGTGMFQGFTPKNNKLYTYPYTCYVLDNNNGSAIELKRENFDTSKQTGDINIIGALTPGCSIRALPVDYCSSGSVLSDGENNQFGLTCGKLPICSFPVDMYTNWLTQNSVNQSLSYLSNAGNIMMGALQLPFNPIGGLAQMSGGFQGIANTIGEQYRASLVPDSARGNTNNGDIMFASGRAGFTVYSKWIKRQFAEVIDNYFSMFGYKVNKLKLPNITGRRNWNYVKCIDVNIIGDIPQKDLEKIRNILNTGCTFWHNPSTFLDYSQNNNIV